MNNDDVHKGFLQYFWNWGQFFLAVLVSTPRGSLTLSSELSRFSNLNGEEAMCCNLLRLQLGL